VQRSARDDDDLRADLERHTRLARDGVEEPPADPTRTPTRDVDLLDERVRQDPRAVRSGRRQERRVDTHLRARRTSEIAPRRATTVVRVPPKRLHREPHLRGALREELRAP